MECVVITATNQPARVCIGTGLLGTSVPSSHAFFLAEPGIRVGFYGSGWEGGEGGSERMASGSLEGKGMGVALALARRGGRRADTGRRAGRRRAWAWGCGYDGMVKEGKARSYLHGVSRCVHQPSCCGLAVCNRRIGCRFGCLIGAAGDAGTVFPRLLLCAVHCYLQICSVNGIAFPRAKDAKNSVVACVATGGSGPRGMCGGHEGTGGVRSDGL